MNSFEKMFSVFAVIFAFALLIVLIMYPETRQLYVLLPITLIGLLVNIGLMFVVLHDVFVRPFSPSSRKYFWMVVILLFWPAVLYYLPKYGFKTRNAD